MKLPRIHLFATGAVLLGTVAFALAADRPERTDRVDKSDRTDRGDRTERRRDRDSGSSRGPASSASPTTAAAPISPSAGFESFQIIAERNIFNPNRIGRTRATTEEKAPRVDEISLVGTMKYDKGLVAFFDSPDASYRKTLQVGQSVGDFKVKSISPNGVELLQGEKPVTLNVAQQLRRPEGGEWTVRTIPNAAPEIPVAVAPTPDSSSSGPMSAEASDALKRLMERRRQQQSNK